MFAASAFLPVKLRIREVAESKGIKRAALARKADITYETLHLLWNDPYRKITLDVAVKLARALDVQVADLYVVEE
jgi:DNA-binding Xre family transcriptional regulator